MQTAPGPFIKTIAAINIALAALALIPALREPMLIAGALFPARFVAGDGAFASVFVLPVWLTPISSAFLHAGILHAGLNMMMLLLLGPNVERVLGIKGIATLFSVGLVAAALAECVAKPNSMVPVVGASGALSAIIAAHVQLFPSHQPKAVGPIPARWAHAIKLMTGWIIFNLMMWYIGPEIGVNIAIWAHIGGFAAGLSLTWPLLHWRYRNA
jgi:membrane associated rhomboid family serine protease